VSDDTLSGGRCKFRRQEFRSSGVQEKWSSGEVEWWSGGVVERWSALFVNTAAEAVESLSVAGIKVHHYPK
jgi:hypothetical protein